MLFAVILYIVTLAPAWITLALSFSNRWIHALIVLIYLTIAITAYKYAMKLGTEQQYPQPMMSTAYPAYRPELAGLITLVLVGCILTITEAFAPDPKSSV